MQRVRAAYLERAAEAPDNHIVVDAARALETVTAELLALIEARL